MYHDIYYNHQDNVFIAMYWCMSRKLLYHTTGDRGFKTFVNRFVEYQINKWNESIEKFDPIVQLQVSCWLLTRMQLVSFMCLFLSSPTQNHGTVTAI